MLNIRTLTIKFWQQLRETDEAIAARVARAGCPHCDGRLHRGDYPRKPRGGAIAVVAEDAERRISLCCDREGCRRRATPPSVRFLGRKVYVGAAIVIASVAALLTASISETRRETGIPTRTLRRWGGWWRVGFGGSLYLERMRGRFVPPLEVAALPWSLIERLSATVDDETTLSRCLAFVAPVTTASVADGARFAMAA